MIKINPKAAAIIVVLLGICFIPPIFLDWLYGWHLFYGHSIILVYLFGFLVGAAFIYAGIRIGLHMATGELERRYHSLQHKKRGRKKAGK